jgi:hypothetical protein
MFIFRRIGVGYSEKIAWSEEAMLIQALTFYFYLSTPNDSFIPALYSVTFPVF